MAQANSARWMAALRPTLSLAVLLACGFSGGVLAGSCAAPPSDAVSSAGVADAVNLEVVVRDTARQPVADAIVVIGDVTARSDAQGHAHLAVKKRGRVVGSVERNGFLKSSVVAQVIDGEPARAFATLWQRAAPQWFKAEAGATLRAGPVTLDLQADAFADSDGKLVSGMIEASLTPIELPQEGGVALPWTLEGVPAQPDARAVDPAAASLPRSITPLLTFGMLDATFTANGKPLQLIKGRVAKLRYRLGAQRASDLPSDKSEIPLWWYKSESGRWHEEGRCTVQEDEAGKYCEGTLAHFTAWNLDVPAGQEDCVRVQVTDAKTGAAVPGAEVVITADRAMYSTGSVATGVDGMVCINIPYGLRVQAVARHTGYVDSASQLLAGTRSAGSMCSTHTCPLYQIAIVPSGTGVSCRSPLLECSGVCVDPRSEDRNCGGCGNACTGGSVCNYGYCQCSDPLELLCSGLCVNTQYDSQNCGGCNRPCANYAQGASCQAGACACSGAKSTRCLSGGTYRCVNTRNDSNHCGACGTVCASGDRCVSGLCVSPWVRITHPPMSSDDLFTVHGGGVTTILSAGKVGTIRFLKDAVMAPAWEVVSARDGMMDVKDDLLGAYVFGRGSTYFTYGAAEVLVGTQGMMTFPNQTWKRTMAAPMQKFIAVAGVDPASGGSMPEVFVLAGDGAIANLYSGAWTANAIGYPMQAVWAQRISDSVIDVVTGGASGRLAMLRYESGTLKSTDTSRTIMDMGTPVTITGITGVVSWFGASKTLVVVGYAGTSGLILSSTDGGTTFRRVFQTSRPLRGVTLTPDGSIFAVGDAATVVRGSLNGGAFLPEVLTGESADLRAVFATREVVVAVGYRTSWRRTL